MLGIGRVDPPVLEWEHSPKEHWVVTTSAIVKSSSDYGFRSPSVGSMAPNPRALSQCCSKSTLSLWNSLTPVAKCSHGHCGRSRKLEMQSILSAVILQPAHAHWNVFGKWVQIKQVFLPNSSQRVIFLWGLQSFSRMISLKGKNFLPGACSLGWFWPRLPREWLVCCEKDYSYSDLERGGIRE